MLEEKIKELLLKQNKQVKELCLSIGMSDTGLRKVYARDSCEISTLRKIASFFNVPMCYFIGEPASNVVASDNSVAAINSEVINIVDAERIKYLEKLLEEKERLIKILLEKK